MIRMIQSSSAAQAKGYFREAFSRSDYFINDQELNGHIQGKLAERLGLNDIATQERFYALCENINPVTGEPLTPRKKEVRTVGYDINFHCPKSVSILHALSNDDHLLKAFENSVQATMRDIESDIKTRVRKDGQYDDRATGELMWTNFLHQTARPVDGHMPDPHLHAHCFTFNATWDEQEKTIKACQFRDIKRDMPYYQARFHKRLSDNLIDLGYQVRRTDKSFEVENVPEKVIDLFSKRTDEIGQLAKEKGITDAKELDALGARTRAKKQKGVSMDELKADWKRQIHELGSDDDGQGKQIIRNAPEQPRELLHAKDCVDHAVLHSFERASVVRDRRLLACAYRQSIGDKSIKMDEITDVMEQDQRLIQVKDQGQTHVTTKEVLSQEQRMVKLARTGQGKLRPLYKKAPDIELDGQQREAVNHVLTTTNRVSIIRGVAGSGKTTLMQEAVKHIEASGKNVTVVAPTSQASRGVLKEEGFENADTVANLLINKKMQEVLAGQVLWVDEAGLLGTKDMTALLELTSKQNARLILGGDTRQHSSVIRGDALRILNTVGEIKTAEVSKIYRQHNEDYRQVVQNLSNGSVEPALKKLDEMRWIKEIDALKPNEQLVADFTETIKAGKTALVVSPTHRQSEDVTEIIREQLRETGVLGKREIIAKRLVNLNLTEAEKADWRNLEPGHLIQFNQNLAGINRGSRWKVQESNDHHVTIRNNDEEETLLLPTDKSAHYDVYREKDLALSQGDIVRVTRNGFDRQEKRLNNGQMLQVTSVKKNGDVELFNIESKAKYKLKKDFGHLTHAYCITSHASQGKTVDEVFISQPASTFPATDSKQLYVSVSRGRDKVHLYTDDKKELLSYASRIGDRQSALELMQKRRQLESSVIEKTRQEMQKSSPNKTKPPVDIYKPITVNKDRDYEPGF
ncbi:relaxase domain-containing protein [Dyadobacter sp. LJ53]|uniref:MobF family relaxase n=1 Tax=Dyadobacter chenwenxiniae TaxID=2906456 RepID=UPI001F3D8A32|nr:MobF family relaxase [Dyadobacter chenwenxiniae]MCF0049537.1 relaxase domain-containing protein [Dyadobacter chenwenxiniae]